MLIKCITLKIFVSCINLRSHGKRLFQCATKLSSLTLFQFFVPFILGGRLVCVVECLWRPEARLQELVLSYNSMASGDQTQSSGRAMKPYLLSLLTGLVCTHLVNDFSCIHVNQVCSLWLSPLSFFYYVFIWFYSQE